MALVQNLDTLQDISMAIKQLAKQNPNKTKAQLLALAKSKFFENFKDNIANIHQSAPPPTKLGPPPPANTLYGRFGVGKRIHDFGAGKCMRFARYVRENKLGIDASDPYDRPEKAVQRGLKSFESATIQDLLPRLPSKTFLTSWMVLTRLPDVTILSGFDGCHLTIHSDLFTGKLPEGEYLHQLRGFNVEGGYLLYTTWKEENLCLTMGEYQPGDHIPETLCEPIPVDQFDFSDSSFKVDGTFRELECFFDPATHSRRTLITGRNGEWAEVNKIDFDCCLHLEETDDAYYLIRVVHWRRFLAPHCYYTIRDFVLSKEITISGKPLIYPPYYSPREAIDHDHPTVTVRDRTFRVPFDGLICRVDGKDYYTKRQWSVDLSPDAMPQLAAGLSERGFELDVIDPGDSLAEYEMTIDEEGAIIHLRFVRNRKDKIRPTPLSTVYHLTTCGTLSDIGAFRATVNMLGQNAVADTMKALNSTAC